MFQRYFFQRYFLLLLLCLFATEFGAQITITSPGIYMLGTDIAYDPGVTTPERVIRISTSNVILDLGGVILSQIGATAGINGIEIDTGLNNIIIRNGIINTVSGNGILVNSNCSNIRIENIQLIGCGTQGIQFAGAAAPNEVKDSVIENCRILRSGLTGNFVGVLLSQTIRTQVNTLLINNNGNAASTFVGVRLSNASDCNLSNMQVNTNTSSSLICFDLLVTVRCVFDACIGRNNSSATTTIQGFNLSGSSCLLNVFNNCVIERNTAITALSSFRLQANSQNNVFQNCIASGNTGNGLVTGFEVTGGTANNLQNAFIECIALNNAAAGGANVCNGFRIDGSNFGIIRNCIASSNTSGSSVGVGIEFATGTGGSNWTLTDNQAVRNTGNNAGNSFGIRVLTGTNNLFTRNIGFNNNTTVANQLSGVASITTPAAPATNNLTAVTAAWTNINAAA